MKFYREFERRFLKKSSRVEASSMEIGFEFEFQSEQISLRWEKMLDFPLPVSRWVLFLSWWTLLKINYLKSLPSLR